MNDNFSWCSRPAAFHPEFPTSSDYDPQLAHGHAMGPHPVGSRMAFSALELNAGNAGPTLAAAGRSLSIFLGQRSSA